MNAYKPTAGYWATQRLHWPPGTWRQPLPIWGDEPDVAALLREALSLWLAGFGEIVLTNRLERALVTVRCKASPPRPWMVGLTEPFSNVKGELIKVAITVYQQTAIDRQLTPIAQTQRLWATLLHEAGHALGLDHHPDPMAVMHRYGWRNTCLTSADRTLFDRQYPYATHVRS